MEEEDDLQSVKEVPLDIHGRDAGINELEVHVQEEQQQNYERQNEQGEHQREVSSH